MTGFEPRTSGIGSNCSTNWATTTATVPQQLSCETNILSNPDRLVKEVLLSQLQMLWCWWHLYHYNSIRFKRILPILFNSLIGKKCGGVTIGKRCRPYLHSCGHLFESYALHIYALLFSSNDRGLRSKVRFKMTFPGFDLHKQIRFLHQKILRGIKLIN